MSRRLVPTCALVLLAGCAVHVRGVVQPSGSDTILIEPEGRERRLLLSGPSDPLRWLDGHFVELDGRAGPRGVRVDDWRVTEGLRGLQVWVGPLVSSGVEVGIADRNSGATYYLDKTAGNELIGHVGDPVLVEGYVEGALRVHVVTWRILKPPEPDP